MQPTHEPAPLLPLLHAYHDRDGMLTDDALREISEKLKIPLADLFGTVTFYHFFARSLPGKAAPRVCDGPICKLRGSDDVLEALACEGATAMPCAGRCDEPIPVLRGDEVLTGLTADDLAVRATPLPPAYPGQAEECVFANIRDEGRATLDGYRSQGGYAALDAARDLEPSQVLDLLEASGLAGRGGAGFPTGRKWRAVAEAPGAPKTIVCNADEGEPGCFKDRVLMDYDPHAVLEGMAIAGVATGADPRLPLPALRVPAHLDDPRGQCDRARRPRPACSDARHRSEEGFDFTTSTCVAARAPTSAARRPRC